MSFERQECTANSSVLIFLRNWRFSCHGLSKRTLSMISAISFQYKLLSRQINLLKSSLVGGVYNYGRVDDKVAVRGQRSGLEIEENGQRTSRSLQLK